MNERIITLEDLRYLRGYTKREGYCIPKTREWFKAHDLDWRDFIRNGIPAQTLLDTGDHFAIEAVRLAEAREGQE